MRLAVLMAVKSPWSRQIAILLSELGHTIHIIDFRDSRDSNETNSSVISQDSYQAEDISMLYNSVSEAHSLKSKFRSNINYILQAPKIAKICRDRRVDAILTLYGGGNALAAWLSRVRPYSVYVVGSDVLLIKGINRWLTRTTLNSAGLVFSNGKYLAEKTRELAPSANVIPLLLGVDTTRFSPGSKVSNPVRIVCTRRFEPVYNNDSLIHALASMPSLSEDLKVTFTSDGALIDSAQNLTKSLLPPAIQQKIEFLGGVSDNILLENVRSAHIFVSMSRSDGTSTSLLEALSCGLFPVLSDIPQNREWIDSSVNNGILVPLDQPEALADALSRAIKDKAWRERVSEYNRNLILERACSRRNMEHLATKLEAIISSHRHLRNKDVY